jgi:hypothetical protein
MCRYLEGELGAAGESKTGQQRHAESRIRFRLDVDAGKNLL